MRARFTLVLLVLFARTLTAQDASTESSATTVFQREAAEYHFTEVGSSKPIEFREQAILRWSNPARNGEDGSVFVWTTDAIPKVVGTCFTFNYQSQIRHKHAFHVLTANALVGKHRDAQMWSPPENSFSLVPLPGAVEPAANATQRMIQLRSLARRFRVQLTGKSGTEESRLVPQPIYRYEAEDGSGTTGALFAFSKGTDPEALLMLESRRDANQKYAWHYGFVRFTFYKLEGFLDEDPVWTAEQSESLNVGTILQRRDYQNLPYITFRSESFLSP